MLKVDMSVDWGGRPLSELQRLMEKRARQLKETPRDACIATAITVLRSLRPLTKVYKGKKVLVTRNASRGIGYVREPNLHTSYTKGGKRCIRIGNLRGNRVELPNTVQLVAPGERAWKTAHVFRVTLSDEAHAKWSKQPKEFFVVASTEAALKSYLQKRYVRIARKWMGTAQYAMKLAQQQISTRHVADPARLGSKARKTAEGNLRVRSFGGDSEWTVQIEDNLAYAAAAFKRSDAVEFAMAKAANSIAGMLRKRADDLLDPSLATPFPEIAQHRRGA